jgi:N-acetylmuramoyl-L-alanine amidase
MFDKAHGSQPHRPRRRYGIPVAIALALVVGGVVVGVLAFTTVSPPGIIRTEPLHTTTMAHAIDPATFASGSCIAYPPSSGNRGSTVFLDAGHGGIDPGGVGITQSGTTIDEADETLPVELDVMALLRAKGFRVVVSRTTNSTVLRLGPEDVSGQLLTLQGVFDEVAARDVCADDARANVLVGIYYDAGGSPENAGSITAYDADRSFSSANLALANLIQNDVLASMNAQGWSIPNGGVLSDTGLGSLSGDPALGGLAGEAAAYDHLLLIGPAMAGYFTTPSEMPGAVVEPLYITDPYEGSIADSVAGQNAIAQGIATAVEQFLTPPPPANPQGSFSGVVHPGRFENCPWGVTSETRSRVCQIPFEPLRLRGRRARSRGRSSARKGD